MLTINKRHLAGFTLVEMMVGMVVSLIVLWGMSAVYVNSSRSSQTSNTVNQLNQDLRAVMDIIVNDVRRAGYWGNATNADNPFTELTTAPITDIKITSNCILYSYDATHLIPVMGGTAGAVDPGVDFAGFRLNAGVVQILDPAGNLTNTAVACANVQWENLTDERALNVTQLTFDTVGSKCISFVRSAYNATVPATYTSWTTTGGLGPACSASVADGGPATPPPATNSFVETRQVRISLAATSKVDPTLSRTLTETVLVRNNRIINP